MAHSVVFDTLAYAKKLRGAGFTEQQAEVQAEALAQIIDERLATKQDIQELRRDIIEMEQRLTYKLTIRLGTMLVAAVGVVAALVKIL